MMEWLLLGLFIGLVLLWRYQLRLTTKHRYSRDQSQRFLWGNRFSQVANLNKTIATHKQANQSLQDELLGWHHLFQLAPIGFLQVDEENQLIFCNLKACEILGIESSRSEKPRLLLELVRSYELDELIEQTRLAQELCQSEWLFHPVNADFAKLTQQQSYLLRGYGIPMSKGRVGVFLESREEVMLLARQRDRWISDAAHELKTPLTSIRLVAETLIPRVDPSLREWVERLLREVIRLGNLVQDLLDLNQLQAQPNARLSFKTLDLARMIQSAWMSLEPLAREKQIQLDYIGAEQLLIQADEARLHRVLLNLLDNGIKYSPSQQHIRVLLGITANPQDASAQCVHLQVIDAGQGFPEEALPFVFERFYRADPSRTRQSNNLDSSKQLKSDLEIAGFASKTRLQSELHLPSISNGNGLGLAIVRQIVEAHQGFVTASNHPETGGAWLQVFLPWQPLE
ncbi:MAG: PAS domain-containing sensor histidine kinase [Leptolyngbyaceae cyanobacterium bins.302]|nr:PAS domain-containing sensor histidine kinase [Leptolyngbyaceae cyanobacterium bins.302]